jgi:hypothetical protein
VIEHGGTYNTVLEKRESEIREAPLVYYLSLSVAPKYPVVVHVAKYSEDKAAPCIHYDDGLSLFRMDFTFTDLSWNEPQAVRINLTRNASTYQGSSNTRFVHSTTSEDYDWAFAFLRPVQVVIVDDDPCVNGAQKIDDQLLSIRKCQCNEGTFVEKKDPFLCASATKCTACPDGMECGPQQALESALLKSGKYRADSSSLNVVECPVLARCNGSATHGDDLCVTGSEGPFCMICELGRTTRYVRSGDDCVICDGGKHALLYGVLFGMGAAVLLVVAFLLRRRQKQAKKSLKIGAAGWETFVDGAQTKYKILIKFIQILSKISQLYPFKLPKMFLAFFKYVNVFFFLDVDFVPFNCVFDTDFHSKLLLMTILPIFFTALIYLVCRIQCSRIRRDGQEGQKVCNEIRKLQSSSIFIVVMVLYSIFPLVSATILQTFSVDERLDDGTAYLMADYNIQWDDPSHQLYRVYGIAMALVYLLALPLFSLWLLHSRKGQIKKVQEAEHKAATSSTHERSGDTRRSHIMSIKEEDPLVAGLSPLFRDYKPRFWWFEISQFFVTTLLCGLVVYFPAESESQVAISLIVSLGMALAFANLSPYLNQADDALAQACQISLSMVLLVGLLLMIKDVNDGAFAIVLIGMNGASLTMGFGLILFEFVQAVAPEKCESVFSWFNLKTSSTSTRQLLGEGSGDGAFGSKRATSRNRLAIHPSESFASTSPPRDANVAASLTTPVNPPLTVSASLTTTNFPSMAVEDLEEDRSVSTARRVDLDDACDERVFSVSGWGKLGSFGNKMEAENRGREPGRSKSQSIAPLDGPSRPRPPEIAQPGLVLTQQRKPSDFADFD